MSSIPEDARKLEKLNLNTHASPARASFAYSQTHSNRSSRGSLPLWDPAAKAPERRYSAITRHHMAMMARNMRLQYLLVALVTILLCLTYAPYSALSRFATSISSPTGPPRFSVRSSHPKQLGELVLRPADWNTRVTLIAVYGGNQDATYLPMFFQTAAQNAKAIDLLFVNVDQGKGCLDLSYVTDPKSPTYGPNIKQLCLDERENDEYYTRFVCKGYKQGCDDNAKSVIMNHLEKLRNHTRDTHDEIFNTFKPWRGLVYKAHLRTEWWGWFDADQLIGSFDQLLPKDIMNNFDMVLPAHSGPAHKALFLPGQLTLFKNNAKMERVPYRYKPLSALEHIHLLQPGGHTPSLDEGEYSDLYINRLTEVDIIRVPDIQGPEPLYGDRRIIVADGHILSAYRQVSRDDVQAWFNRVHDEKFRSYRVGDTISEHGVTIPVNVSHERTIYCNDDVWNPINTCPEWKPTYASRALLYRKGGKDWKIRMEPRLYSTHDWSFASMEPKMFVHFLVMKRQVDHWKMPNMIQSGFRRERVESDWQPGEGLKKRGRKVAVMEMAWDWWGSWDLTVGDGLPPRGFDHWHRFKDVFFGEEKNDHYWRYHHWESSKELVVKPPPADMPEPWHYTAEIVPEN